MCKLRMKPLLMTAAALMLCVTSRGANVPDVDTVDAGDTDNEAALKCDACLLMAVKFSAGFTSAESAIKSVRLSEREATEAAEGVCDAHWDGYGTVTEDSIMRLAGPDTGRTFSSPVVDTGTSIWGARLQDLCDELLAEVPSESRLYEAWAAGGSLMGGGVEALELMLCKGEGTFGACASQNWGPWPGDDDEYEDYEDGDTDYVHDEF